MNRSFHYFFRKAHRYLGIIIGVQFLFWALGGLYFAWNNIDQIHSDPYKSPPSYFDNSVKLASPQVVIDKLNEKYDQYEIEELELINVLNVPVYRILISNLKNTESRYLIADASNGELRPPLSKDESVKLAIAAFLPDAAVKNVEYITEENVGRHHEYREKILPAYAVSFDHSSGVTVYVSPEMGQIVTFRNSNWRIFDFLWMMHTMDYSGRDNFGNYLLRFFAIFGLITVISGFILFFFSSGSLFKRSKK